MRRRVRRTQLGHVVIGGLEVVRGSLGVQREAQSGRGAIPHESRRRNDAPGVRWLRARAGHPAPHRPQLLTARNSSPNSHDVTVIVSELVMT